MDHFRSHLRWNRQYMHRGGQQRILLLATAAAVCVTTLMIVARQFDAHPAGAGRALHSVDGPLLPPVPADPGEYHFSDTISSGDPIGWNPCTPIPYWIGSKNLPGGGTDLITWVLAEITAISGQPFDFQGYTDTVPNFAGDNPVKGAWIGWTTETSTQTWIGHELDGDQPAVGMASDNYDGADDRVTRGWAMLLYSYNRRADARAGAVLRHELGHLLGLAHTMSEAEVMSPGGPTQDWGPGDRRGLWLLGPSRGCD